MDLQAYLEDRTARVDRYLDDRMPPADVPPADLHAAMRHLVFPGGKRLRPALCFAACEAFGAPTERALPMAAAVELVHNYSLVHDDLPCMDDDDERRGRPTVHVRFGEAMAVLAGDALQALAFGVLADAPDVPADRVLDSVGDLAALAGAAGMVGGQADDLGFPADAFQGSAGAEAVEAVHLRKSAALIAAAVVGGARFAGAEPERLATLRRFALDVGVAFQIADDVEDRDDEEPCSLVRVLGMDAARERAEQLLVRALESIEGLGEPAEPLRDLARYAVERTV
ncbi:MAG: polyprenyl synthetase family protein [Myxococcales bacterium]|nr:polyprenyl synthetase family protein [Myxococcales bacterium]